MSQPAFDFGDDAAGLVDEPTEITYSVAELADAINGTLRRSFGDGVWVRGEIQGWNERGPHAYFRLVEDGPNGKAVLNVQFFAGVRARLRPLLEKHRLRLADGLKVRIHGHLDLYAPSGSLGLKMAGIDARFTLGDLAMQRSEVVRRLVAGGLYDANRSRRLSPVPLRIGVVTSVGSAAWHDFSDEIDRSGFGFLLRVVDVRVQGDTAVDMVSRAIRYLGRQDDLDAVVVVRGGGARSELATFDAEEIAVAIATSSLPVLTGLGHEIDRSVADEVAFRSLKTPTACAAALVGAVADALGRAEDAFTAVVRRARHGADLAASRLDERAAAVAGRVGAALDRSTDRLDQRHRQVVAAVGRRLDRAEGEVTAALAAIGRVPLRLDAEERHLAALETQVRLVDPVRTLARGWSITRTSDGRTVRTSADLQPGDVVVTTFADGAATSRVEAVVPAASTEEQHTP